MPLSVRLSTLICTFVVTGIASIGCAHADDKFELCGIDQSTFRDLAFSSLAGPNFERKIVKWTTPPRLAVLSGVGSPVVEVKIRAVEKTVERYLTAYGVATSYHSYSDYANAATIVNSLDQNTVIVFIDGPAFDESVPVDEGFLGTLTSILRSPEIAESLIATTRTAGRQNGTHMTIDLRTGEIVAAASLIDAKSSLEQIAAGVFTGYFTAFSPSILANADAAKTLFSGSGWQIKLTPVGEAYFAVVSNPEVKIGAPEESFVACSTGN